MRIHSNRRASGSGPHPPPPPNRTRRSSSSPYTAMSSKQKDNASFADDEYVRRVLYPWDTQLHRHVFGDVE